MQYSGQIQQKVMLKRFNCLNFLIYCSFGVKKKETNTTM